MPVSFACLLNYNLRIWIPVLDAAVAAAVDDDDDNNTCYLSLENNCNNAILAMG